MLHRFNLEQQENRSRHGTDAVLDIDGQTLEFELKSVTSNKGGLTTVRDFGPDHIAKWKNKHWLIAVYASDALLHCKYASPATMAPWIEEKWQYIRADFQLANHVPELIGLDTLSEIVGKKASYTYDDARKLHKSQYAKSKYVELMDLSSRVRGKTKPSGYSPERMLYILRDRARYILQRGSTLNNPHIPLSYFAGCEEIKRDHASRLRELVREWLAASKPAAHVPPPEPPDIPLEEPRNSR